MMLLSVIYTDKFNGNIELLSDNRQLCKLDESIHFIKQEYNIKLLIILF